MNSPLIYSDFPDPDVIRVDGIYYMVSTTMHMFPGGDIYQSTDLINWEFCCHIYDKLDETPEQLLKHGNIYGMGMWAACIRWHHNRFHVFFVCNDTHKTYHFYADNVKGPWKYNEIKGFYHDCSVLFDDERAYIVYGNREIHLTELNRTLDGPAENGIDAVILKDLAPDRMMLGFEGSHFYKINGRYYLFLIHWPQGGRRTQACYVADRITGPYFGGDVLSDDMGFYGQGVAQGGIVEAPDGTWHSVLFQDRGAIGRVPVLCDVTWVNDYPVFSIPDIDSSKESETLCIREESFRKPFSPMWQFNHQPDEGAYEISEEGICLNLNTAEDMESARNTLTQRAFGPKCKASLTVDGSQLQEGGRAGFGILQGCFAGIFVEKRSGKYHLCSERRIAEKRALKSYEPVSVTELLADIPSCVRINMYIDFTDMTDTLCFTLAAGDDEKPLGINHKLHYRLDHFMGARIAIYGYDTVSVGSKALFRDFNCEVCRK